MDLSPRPFQGTHTIRHATACYASGPHQSRPPEATLQPGTIVMVSEADSGSHVWVEVEDGPCGWVQATALSPIS